MTSAWTNERPQSLANALLLLNNANCCVQIGVDYDAEQAVDAAASASLFNPMENGMTSGMPREEQHTTQKD